MCRKTVNDAFLSIWVKDKCVGLGTGFELNEGLLTLRRMEIFINDLPIEVKDVIDIHKLEPFIIQIETLPQFRSNAVKYTDYFIIEYPVSYNAGAKYVFKDVRFRVVDRPEWVKAN